MRTRTVVLLVAAVAVFAATAPASEAAPWKPGTPYYVEETEMADLLEKTFDQAYCQGISRFGKRGEFPYEKFLRFDCTTTLNGASCVDRRVRSVRAVRRGWFTLRQVRPGDCF